MRILEAKILGSVCILPLQLLLSHVVVECLGQSGSEGDLKVVESFTILSSKLSLQEYCTHVATLDVVHQLPAEQLRDARPTTARGSNRSL